MRLIKSLLSSLFLSVFFISCGIGGGASIEKGVMLEKLELSNCTNTIAFNPLNNTYDCILAPDVSESTIKAEASRMFRVSIDGEAVSEKTITVGAEPVNSIISVVESISGKTSQYVVSTKKDVIGLKDLQISGIDGSNLISFDSGTNNYSIQGSNFIKFNLTASLNCVNCPDDLSRINVDLYKGNTTTPYVSYSSLRDIVLENIEIEPGENIIRVSTSIKSYQISINGALASMKQVSILGDGIENNITIVSTTQVLTVNTSTNNLNFRIDDVLGGEDITATMKIGNLNPVNITEFPSQQYELTLDPSQPPVNINVVLKRANATIINYNLTAVNLYSLVEYLSSASLNIMKKTGQPLNHNFDIQAGSFSYGHNVPSYLKTYKSFKFEFIINETLIDYSKTEVFLNGINLTLVEPAVISFEYEAPMDGPKYFYISINKRYKDVETPFSFKFKDSLGLTKTEYYFTIKFTDATAITGLEEIKFYRNDNSLIKNLSSCGYIGEKVDKNGGGKITQITKSYECDVYCGLKWMTLSSATDKTLNKPSYGYLFQSRLKAKINENQCNLNFMDIASLSKNTCGELTSSSDINVEFENYVSGSMFQHVYKFKIPYKTPVECGNTVIE